MQLSKELGLTNNRQKSPARRRALRFQLSSVVVANRAIKPSGLHAAFFETGAQIHTGIDRCALISLRASSRRAQRELRASRVFRMGIPFLRLLERSKAGLVFELRLLAHGAPPSSPRHCGRDVRNARAAQ